MCVFELRCCRGAPHPSQILKHQHYTRGSGDGAVTTTGTWAVYSSYTSGCVTVITTSTPNPAWVLQHRRPFIPPPPVRLTRVTSFGTATGTISVELWLPPFWTGWPLACLGPQYFAFGTAMRSFTTERDDGGGGVGGWRWLGSGGVLGCLCPARWYACGGVFGCFGPALAFNDDGFTT